MFHLYVNRNNQFFIYTLEDLEQQRILLILPPLD